MRLQPGEHGHSGLCHTPHRNGTGEYILKLLAFSKGWSNISDVTAFHEGEMGSSVTHSQSMEDVSFQFARRQPTGPLCAAWPLRYSRGSQSGGPREGEEQGAHHGA